eukprot:SAG31_NODE_492_length_14913_cov_4.109086_11_plen_168_part_00
MRGVVATVAAVVVAATAAAAAAAAPPPPAENAGSLDDRQQQLLEEVVELHRKLQSHAGSHGALNFSAAVAAAVGKEEAEEDAAPDPMDPVYNNTIVVIVLVLILLSVMFEQGKDWIEDTFGGPDFKNIVAQMVRAVGDVLRCHAFCAAAENQLLTSFAACVWPSSRS